MSDFKVIETQEELDRIIGARLARQEEKYSDYSQLKSRVEELEKENSGLRTTLEDSKKSTGDYESKLAELEGKIAGYETANLKTKIALKNGLPYDLASRLQGDSEEALKEDAERLASLIKPNDPNPIFKDQEGPKTGLEGDLKQMLGNLT